MRALAILIVVAACGPKGMYSLTTKHKDNDPAELSSALGRRQLASQPSVVNTAGKPRVFVVQAGKPKTLLAYDLNAKSVMWKLDADVHSRVWVGGDFIVTVEAKQLVAREQQTGSVRWKVGINGDFVGASADRERAYIVTREGGGKPTWYLTAFDGRSGKVAWRADPSQGALGAPVAHGGVVYSPFLSQWMIVLDAKTGAPLARLRGLDEQISMLRVTSTTAYFGSKQGVFVLDPRAAAGKRSEATYGQVKVPPQLERTSYGVDVYDPVQAAYTAADRARVLWWSEPTSNGPMKFAGDTYAVHYFRYVFGFDMAGELTWVYSNPRVELVASEHMGTVIVAIDSTGLIAVIDPKTGALRGRASLGTTAPVLGATFDADGWNPQGTGEKVDTVTALIAIVHDRDARFEKVKELAVAGLAKHPGPEVTKELLAVLADKRASIKLKDSVVETLAKRKDPSALPALTAQLASRFDYLAKTEPESLGPVARAIAGLRGVKLDPAHVSSTLNALESHLEDPATQSTDLVAVIDAIAALGGASARVTLSSHLLLYHADDDIGSDSGWQRAIVAAIAANPGPVGRAALRQVSTDPRTKQGLAQAIKETLVNE